LYSICEYAAQQEEITKMSRELEVSELGARRSKHDVIKVHTFPEPEDDHGGVATASTAYVVMSHGYVRLAELGHACRLT
jgi:hypothetical protein